MRVTINGTEHRPEGRAECDRLLAEARRHDDLEIWIAVDGGGSLCGLLNERVGWLMFLDAVGEPGFSSRNPAAGAEDGGTETFLLGNGQADDYPKTWTYDRATIFMALSQFANSGERPSDISWHDNSAG